jgi:tetratricopeptide (TPR) repeat protein
VRACLGQYDEALEGMFKTLRWLESLQQFRYQLIAYDLIGHLLIECGRNREAVEQCERGLAMARDKRIVFWISRVHANLAIARLRLGDLEVGGVLERAAAYCRQNAELFQLARCLEGLAELALARGDPAGCLAFADELLSLVEPAGLRELIAQARRWRGEALLFQREYGKAETELSAALAIAEEIGRPRLARDAQAALSRTGVRAQK